MRYYFLVLRGRSKKNQFTRMAWRSSPEAPVNASGSGRIGTPLLRLVVCSAVVLAITAVLYSTPS